MTKNIDNDELNLMVSVVKKYYEMGMTQEQIAKEEFISKSSVCRLIKKAASNGILSFQINYPVDSVYELENEFYSHFDLDKVVIAPTFIDDIGIRVKDTCRMVASDLCKIIRPNDILGVSWGLTMDQLAGTISTEMLINRKCDKVVMLNGSIASEVYSTKSSYIVEQFADFFSAEGYLLPVPMIVDSKELADMLKADSHIKYVMEFANNSHLAVFSIGSASYESVLRKRGAYSREDYEDVLTRGAVGDILGRCFDMDGRPIRGDIDDRIIGMDIETLKTKKVRIGVGVGNKKARAIIGALRGGVISRLYTDGMTAREIVKLLNVSR
jgi:deoxyribonucleoside regulator